MLDLSDVGGHLGSLWGGGGLGASILASWGVGLRGHAAGLRELAAAVANSLRSFCKWGHNGGRMCRL